VARNEFANAGRANVSKLIVVATDGETSGGEPVSGSAEVIRFGKQRLWILEKSTACSLMAVNPETYQVQTPSLQARSQVLRFGVQNNFLANKYFYYMIIKKLSEHNNIWSGTKKVGDHCPRLPHPCGCCSASLHKTLRGSSPVAPGVAFGWTKQRSKHTKLKYETL